MTFPSTWSDEERQMVEDYQKSVNTVNPLPKDYFKEKPKPEPIERVNLVWLAKKAVKQWEANENRKMILTPENRPVYALINQYFAKDPEFNKTILTENKADLNKGLLLIGGFGCGKTSIMKAYHDIGMRILEKTNDKFMYFRMVSANGIVREYESIEAPADKDTFFNRYIKGKVYFDDFGTESMASNFGKRNLMKDILEERYLKGNPCHLTTNLSLEEIEQKYGGRVYDRMKEMFNVIVLKGRSFRE